MTDKYPESTSNGGTDEFAKMWEVDPKMDGGVVNVEDAAVRPSPSGSPRLDGSPYIAPRPTDEQVGRAKEHGFDLGLHRDKYYK